MTRCLEGKCFILNFPKSKSRSKAYKIKMFAENQSLALRIIKTQPLM